MLDVIEGGGEEEERLCCSEEMADLIDEMFQALPAASIREIAESIDVPEWKVGDLLIHLRGNAESHGWTVPHAKRGRTTEQERFFAVLVDSDEEPYADADSRIAVAGGLDGTLGSIEAMAENESTALRLYRSYLPHTLQRRRINRLLRSLRNVREEAHDAREEGIGWANGEA